MRFFNKIKFTILQQPDSLEFDIHLTDDELTIFNPKPVEGTYRIIELKDCVNELSELLKYCNDGIAICHNPIKFKRFVDKHIELFL